VKISHAQGIESQYFEIDGLEINNKAKLKKGQLGLCKKPFH